MAQWIAPNMWQDGECFIIGGGPSMPRQFGVPGELIRKVVSRKEQPNAYSPYLAPIHDKHVIGINNAYQIGNWIDVLFFGDCAWYRVHRKRIAGFPGLKVTCCKRFTKKAKEEMEGIKHLSKDSSHRHGISSNKSRVSWNANSGSAAINMAIHFGVKRIILLGFDMSLEDNKVSHWHGSHGNPGEKRKPPPFNRHLRGFPAIAQDAKKLGVEIINASSNSSIQNFKKMTMQEILANSFERVA
ncbi:MAG: hypothetical protein V3U75_13045 [Methylococcaceae bacterium]